MDKTNRNNNYDLLRVLSCVAVVLLHVNFLYFGEKSLMPSNSYLWIIESIINIITRFCVPCFVMISGAFLLSDDKNSDFVFFYKKRFIKVLIPSCIIGLLIFVCSVIKSRNIIFYINQIIEGTFYNYWYIYMTIGLYMLTPIIIRIKKSLTLKQYIICACVLLLWSIISQATTIYRFPYALGVVVSFASYYVIGNIIYENSQDINISRRITFFICILSIVLCFIWRYVGHNNKMFVYEAYSNFFSPFISLLSIMLFIFFAKSNVQIETYKLSRYTLYIYLFHTFIYQILYSSLNNLLKVDELVKILVIFMLTIVLSLMMSIVFNKIYQSICKYYKKRKVH